MAPARSTTTTDLGCSYHSLKKGGGLSSSGGKGGGGPWGSGAVVNTTYDEDEDVFMDPDDNNGGFPPRFTLVTKVSTEFVNFEGLSVYCTKRHTVGNFSTYVIVNISVFY